MKRLYFFIFLVICHFGVFAQCNVDTSINAYAFENTYNDGVVGAAYDWSETFYLSATGNTLQIQDPFPTTLSFDVDTFRIDSITDLPTGLSFEAYFEDGTPIVIGASYPMPANPGYLRYCGRVYGTPTSITNPPQSVFKIYYGFTFSMPFNNIHVTNENQLGIYDASGYQPEICIVSYCQSNGGYCVIWEKPTVPFIESFNIYTQDTGTGQQVLLDTWDYDSLSVYTDTSFLGYSGVRKYWISATLVGGSETPLSQRHEPIKLNSQIVGTDINIFWNEYFPYHTPSWEYDIYKGSSPNNLQLVQANWWITTGYLFPNPTSPEYYAVKVSDYSASCNPTRNSFDIWSNVISNITIGQNELSSLVELNVSPNPSNGKFIVEYTANNGAQFYARCINVQGQVVHAQSLAYSRTEIDMSTVAKGLYMLQVLEEGNIVKNERIVVN